MTEVRHRVSIEQLIALNEEIASLVRAGVPLELGLRNPGSSVPATLRRINQDLARRLQAGESLPDSLQSTMKGLPRIYLAAVEAGLKSGQLVRTLELLCRFMQQGVELRQKIEFAFVYPLIVSSLAYALLTVAVIHSAEHWTEMWGDAAFPHTFVYGAMQQIVQSWRNWIAIPPVIIVLGLVGWFGFGRRSLLPDRKPSLLTAMIPGLPKVIRYWHWSIFCETAQLLIERQVPLPEALRLAGGAAGSPFIDRTMASLAQGLEQGQPLNSSLEHALPPLLRWVLGQSERQELLVQGLRDAGKLYFEQAQYRAEFIKTWLPLILTVVIGGGAVLVYAVGAILPITGFVEELVNA